MRSVRTDGGINLLQDLKPKLLYVEVESFLC